MALDPTSYKLLAFDIYGTLIDWEAGIFSRLLPLYTRLDPSSPHHPSHHTPTPIRKQILTQYHSLELSIQKEHPTLPYPEVLEKVYVSIANTFGLSLDDGEAKEFGRSIGSWPAFPDTVSAMQTLSKHYKLVVLSNVDQDSFSRTLSGPLSGVAFDAIYTAQDIGSYKPDLRNFEYLIEHVRKDFGVGKDEIWMVAQSLVHDHRQVKKMGMRSSVWISRGGEVAGEGPVMGGGIEEMKEEVDLGATFSTLGEFAAAVEEGFKEKGL